MRTFIVIDGHNLVYRSLFGLPKSGKGKYLEKKQDKEYFNKQIIQHTMGLLNAWKTVADGAVFVWDFGSWRKEMCASDYVGEIGYKANRNTELKVDKARFAECIEDFKKWLDLCKIAQCECYGAEGDDWICTLSRRLNERGDSVIIYSNDGDLHQLVTDGVMELAKGDNGTYTLFATKGDCKRFTKKETAGVIEHMLGGGSLKIDALKLLFGEMMATGKLVMTPVDAQTVLFEKILSGDKSDNIPSICTMKKKGRDKNGNEVERVYSLTPAMGKIVLDGFYRRSGLTAINEMCYFNPDLQNMLCESILEVAKLKLKDAKENTYYDESVDTVRHNLMRNIRLVMLGDNTIPSNISDAMSKRADEIVADGAYLNWSVIDSWWLEHAPEYTKMDVNAMRRILTKEERETDWGFIRKDGAKSQDANNEKETPVNDDGGLGIMINGKLF